MTIQKQNKYIQNLNKKGAKNAKGKCKNVQLWKIKNAQKMLKNAMKRRSTFPRTLCPL